MDKTSLEAIALSIRTLTMDAVQKANSGHPGMPMGLAELGALLYGETLRVFPGDPEWADRDRFVLSAGHGSMLLYSLLHLAGYGLSLDDIRNFRQLGSKTAGHPEYGLAPGIETTTGPLGQGFANGVGMAIAERFLAARFNTPKHEIINHFTYVISGDGCMMEGVTSEAASLAGHLGLGKLTVFYDANRITIEGSTDLAFTEDVGKRFEAYNWHVQRGDAYDVEGIARMIELAKKETDRPSLIIVKSIIARGSPNMAGSHETHGAALGEEEVRAAKKAMGVPQDSTFYVHPAAIRYFEEKRIQWKKEYSTWQDLFKEWARENSDLHSEWKRYFSPPELDGASFADFKTGDKVATRSASGKILNALAGAVPNLVGGSADLAPSNKTDLAGMGDFQKDSYGGRNFHFGVREHAMGAIVNGMALHGGLRPFCATFLVFSDYMRPPMRLAALMKLPIVYVFTHDSIHVGEDGPTHEPVEHLAALRAIPNMRTLRPADAEETQAAWRMALQRQDGPTSIALTRQNLEVFQKADRNWRETIEKGAYIVKDASEEPELVVIATGSEVGLALEAVKSLSDSGIRIVSMISRELFYQQAADFRERLVPSKAKRLVIEAGISFGWEALAGENGAVISIDRFGESGPAKAVAEHLGLSVKNVISQIRKLKS
ncbi:MAG TPA: transketolase [Spirochaetia bacterium]|nr:transketolase [Spirochaetia bacterium]